MKLRVLRRDGPDYLGEALGAITRQESGAHTHRGEHVKKGRGTEDAVSARRWE